MTNSSALLHPSNVIDQTFKTEWILTLALCHQWFGVYISPEKWSDMWIPLGIAGYLASIVYKEHFGDSEMKFLLFTMMEYLLNSPKTQALSFTKPPSPHILFGKHFFTKSLLIVHLIEKYIEPDKMKLV